ncbi:MAG: YlxR family protein [Anaerolineae bacterium]|jgi:predicted RNA-binding protein YlxR (DUF448 family)|nr:YlxR family protein [Anaerolineae bacterium]
MRTCAGCREVTGKRQMVRIVRTPNGIEIDTTGKKAGRGMYLHRDPDCWQKGINGGVARALRTELTEADRKLLNDYLEILTSESESGE